MEHLVPLFVGSYQEAALVYSYLAGDELHPILTPNVRSLPLQSPAAHGVRSLYTEHVVLVPPAEEDRARELIDSFQNSSEDSSSG